MFAADYREIARKALKGKWKRVTAILFLGGLLYGGVELVRFQVEIQNVANGASAGQQVLGGGTAALLALLGLLSLSVGAWVRVGSYNMGNRLMDGEAPRVGMLFPPEIFWKCVAMNLLRTLYVFLWTLLLIVPGILAAYSYSMADYLLSRHPEMGASEALRESKRMMMGRRGGLFCLEMSFIGWALLCQAPVYVITLAVAGARASVTPTVVFVLLGFLVYWVASCFLDSYIHMAEVAFFRDAEAPEFENQGETGFGWDGAEEQAGFGEAGGDAAPDADAGRRVTALTADETVARDVFVSHGCSRNRMRAEGVLEEYEKLNVDASFELRWLRDYANGLMLRFDRDPAALDEILELSAEYAMDDLVTRALERVERHIRQETLPCEEILNMAGRVLALVVSGAFADQPDFVRRRMAQVVDIADRMERRLSEEQGDGPWRRALELIRQMCQN